MQQNLKMDHIKRISEQTGFDNKEKMMEYMTHFESRKKNINSSLELVNSAKSFLNQMERQITSLRTALSGKRDWTSSIADILQEVLDHYSKILVLDLPKKQIHEGIAIICKNIDKSFNDEVFLEKCKTLSYDKLQELMEMDDDDNDMDDFLDIILDRGDSDDSGDSSDGGSDLKDIKIKIDNRKQQKKETFDQETKKEIQDKIKKLKGKLNEAKQKEREKKAKKKMEPKILGRILSTVKRILQQGRREVLNIITKPFLENSIGVCYAALPLAIAYGKTSSAITSDESQYLLEYNLT